MLRHMLVDSARVSSHTIRTGRVLKGVLAGLDEGLRSLRVRRERRVEAAQNGLARTERSRAGNHSTESSHRKMGLQRKELWWSGPESGRGRHPPEIT